jgi:DNA/RNA-binding domain of Phe-tRNA-synthetase-like protein
MVHAGLISWPTARPRLSARAFQQVLKLASTLGDLAGAVGGLGSMFQISAAWASAYPDAHVGVLMMREVANPPHHPELEKRKAALEEQLRARWAGQDRRALEQLPVLRAYNAYYGRFKKSYHVQLQLESIVFKGKPLPTVAALVETMFMAEVKNLLLTAGHDLDKTRGPLTLNVAQGDETYLLMRGQPQTLKAGDMFIADGAGILSSIIYGPDQRTAIGPDTRRVVFTVYAPPGIAPPAVLQQLEDIRQNVASVAPAAQVELLKVFGAAG